VDAVPSSPGIQGAFFWGGGGGAKGFLGLFIVAVDGYVLRRPVLGLSLACVAYSLWSSPNLTFFF